jgi:hypothetical protein
MASGKAVIGKKAPDFKAEAVVGGDFKTVQLSDYTGAHAPNKRTHQSHRSMAASQACQ